MTKRSSCGIVANVQDYDIVVSEFDLQLHYLVPFEINTLILPAIC